jgi:hypothetical protein
VHIYLHCPIRQHGVVLNLLSTGTTLPYLSFREAYSVWCNSINENEDAQTVPLCSSLHLYDTVGPKPSIQTP